LEPHNEQLLLAAPLSVADGSLRSPAAFIIVAPQQNCGRWADPSSNRHTMTPATSVRLRKYAPGDRTVLLDMAIAAFTPIHESFRSILGPELFRAVYPDWKASQTGYLEQLLDGDEAQNVWVAEDAGSGEMVGFVHYSINTTAGSGEIGINAVAPHRQRAGIGTAMYDLVLGLMGKQGVRLVHVSTGGDDSHLAARRAYEKVGFRPLPLTRLYKRL
jgi:ribosomal protein S18 acetylase RimI-like enzyme